MNTDLKENIPISNYNEKKLLSLQTVLSHCHVAETSN